MPNRGGCRGLVVLRRRARADTEGEGSLVMEVKKPVWMRSGSAWASRQHRMEQGEKRGWARGWQQVEDRGRRTSLAAATRGPTRGER